MKHVVVDRGNLAVHLVGQVIGQGALGGAQRHLLRLGGHSEDVGITVVAVCLVDGGGENVLRGGEDVTGMVEEDAFPGLELEAQRVALLVGAEDPGDRAVQAVTLLVEGYHGQASPVLGLGRVQRDVTGGNLDGVAGLERLRVVGEGHDVAPLAGRRSVGEPGAKALSCLPLLGARFAGAPGLSLAPRTFGLFVVVRVGVGVGVGVIIRIGRFWFRDLSVVNFDVDGISQDDLEDVAKETGFGKLVLGVVDVVFGGGDDDALIILSGCKKVSNCHEVILPCAEAW